MDIIQISRATSVHKFIAAVSLCAGPIVCNAQSTAPPPPQPLFASLPVPIDASTVKVGSHIQAWLTEPWTGNACVLRKGAILEGRVSQVERRSKTDKKSALHLVFDRAECDHHKGTPFRATLIALLGPLGSAAPGGESGVTQGASLTEGTPVGPQIGLRSVETASANNMDRVISRHLPAQWKLGMVVDVPGTILDVGTAEEGGSIVWTMNRDARLEGGTMLILLPAPPPTPPTPVPAPATP